MFKTHRCHQKEFLLKFVKDRQRWRYWLFEAKKRYGLSVLNYVVTSNHIHLLVHDLGNGEIARSMQLIAGRTAQEYNKRKGRRGAYWEDRYHATAVDTEDYLARCMVYIDMNMIRAGAVKHPMEWDACGYSEIQFPRVRYNVIDTRRLMDLFAVSDFSEFQNLHRNWVEEELKSEIQARDDVWTHTLAVGRSTFVENIKAELSIKAQHRDIEDMGDAYTLREPIVAYQAYLVDENGDLSNNDSIIAE